MRGNRRNPYRVRKTVGWKNKGQAIVKNVGYYPTRKDALEALAKMSVVPQSPNNKQTLGEMWKGWCDRNLADRSLNTQNAYKTAAKKLSHLMQEPINTIALADLQDVIDAQGSHPAKNIVKTVISLSYEYAVKNEVLSPDRNKIAYLEVGKKEKSDCHYRFTDAEMEKLWQNQDNPDVQVVLVLIYTGCRKSELLPENCVIDVDNRRIAIKSAKNAYSVRDVPISRKILPFFQNGLKMPETKRRQEKAFAQALTACGILNYTGEDGEQHTHKLHDTRHTFTSMWTEKGLSDVIGRKIEGHSGKGIAEQVYTHITFARLLEEVDKL